MRPFLAIVVFFVGSSSVTAGHGCPREHVSGLEYFTKMDTMIINASIFTLCISAILILLRARRLGGPAAARMDGWLPFEIPGDLRLRTITFSTYSRPCATAKRVPSLTVQECAGADGKALYQVFARFSGRMNYNKAQKTLGAAYGPILINDDFRMRFTPWTRWLKIFYVTVGDRFVVGVPYKTPGGKKPRGKHRPRRAPSPLPQPPRPASQHELSAPERLRNWLKGSSS